MGSGPNMVSWIPKDLTTYWPVIDLHPVRNRLRLRTVLHTTDIDGFYTLWEEYPQSVITYSIPPRYRNAIAMISAKIRWFQLGLMHKPLNRKSSQADRNAFALVMDGFRRNFEFTLAVRKEFLGELEHDKTFESRTLDSWLHVEYHSKQHAPPTYSEYREVSFVEKHPLDITVEGG